MSENRFACRRRFTCLARAPEDGEGDVVDFWTVVYRDDEARRLVLRRA